MNNANVHDLFGDFSYKDSISGFDFDERLELYNVARDILSKSEPYILEPFKYSFTQDNRRWVEFINRFVLREKDFSTGFLIIDPVHHTEPLVNFLDDIVTFVGKGVTLNWSEQTLKILNQARSISTGNYSLKFLAQLLLVAPNTVSYEQLSANSIVGETSARTAQLLRNDLFKYLLSVGFTNRSTDYLRSKIVNVENLGYYFKN